MRMSAGEKMVFAAAFAESVRRPHPAGAATLREAAELAANVVEDLRLARGFLPDDEDDVRAMLADMIGDDR